LNKSYHFLSVVGARPQFIKLAGLNLALKHYPQIKHTVVHSGQHYDSALSGDFFNEFYLPEPDVSLQMGSSRQCRQIADGIVSLDEAFQMYNPDIVLVYGDTNTTAAAAIAAAKAGFPIAHIEAGLREFDKSIPEETNKLIADALADIWFAPTQTAVKQLANEGKTKHVYLTGDLVLDLLYEKYGTITKDRSDNNPYAFVTCHRAANTDNIDRLTQILTALTQLPLQVEFSMHPRTAKAIQQHQLGALLEASNVHCIGPGSFWKTQRRIRDAHVVLTDSGGLIKEAYFHQTPCIILDDQTEWIESVAEGWAKITGADTHQILQTYSSLTIPQQPPFRKMGDGRAGVRILQHLIDFIDGKASTNSGSGPPYG